MSDSNSSKSASDNQQSADRDDMEDENSSQPIPERWRFVTTSRKNGSTYSYYLCPETRQRFPTYEDMIRYVLYADRAMVSIYSPYFCARPRKGDIPDGCRLSAGPSSEMPASNEGEEDTESDDTSSDSENFDIPEDGPTEEEYNSIPDIYKLPPMDCIELLPLPNKPDKGKQKAITEVRGKSLNQAAPWGNPGSKNKYPVKRRLAMGEKRGRLGKKIITIL